MIRIVSMTVSRVCDIDLNHHEYGGFVDQASKSYAKRQLPAGYTDQWSGEYEFQRGRRNGTEIICPWCFGFPSPVHGFHNTGGLYV